MAARLREETTLTIKTIRMVEHLGSLPCGGSVETEIVLNVKMEPLEEGGFVATSPDLPGLVV
jgi:hypothetical protein